MQRYKKFCIYANFYSIYLCNSNYFSNFASEKGNVWSFLLPKNSFYKFLEMENRSFEEKKEPEIVYSHSVKAGKRIYYLDVKKARNEDLYLCITESKKKQGLEDEMPQFEKHKVFLYREDFDHFKEALQDVIGFVEGKLGKMEARPEWTPEANNEETAQDAAESEPKKKGLFGFIKKD